MLKVTIFGMLTLAACGGASDEGLMMANGHTDAGPTQLERVIDAQPGDTTSPLGEDVAPAQVFTGWPGNCEPDRPGHCGPSQYSTGYACTWACVNDADRGPLAAGAATCQMPIDPHTGKPQPFVNAGDFCGVVRGMGPLVGYGVACLDGYGCGAAQVAGLRTYAGDTYSGSTVCRKFCRQDRDCGPTMRNGTTTTPCRREGLVNCYGNLPPGVGLCPDDGVAQ